MLYSVLSRDTERGRGQLCCIVFYLGIQRERERSAVLYSVLSRDTEREREVSCVV